MSVLDNLLEKFEKLSFDPENRSLVRALHGSLNMKTVFGLGPDQLCLVLDLDLQTLVQNGVLVSRQEAIDFLREDFDTSIESDLFLTKSDYSKQFNRPVATFEDVPVFTYAEVLSTAERYRSKGKKWQTLSPKIPNWLQAYDPPKPPIRRERN